MSQDDQTGQTEADVRRAQIVALIEAGVDTAHMWPLVTPEIRQPIFTRQEGQPQSWPASTGIKNSWPHI